MGLVRVALAHVAAGMPPGEAAARALATLRERTGATAGVVLVGSDGTPGVAFTTAAMPTAIR